MAGTAPGAEPPLEVYVRMYRALDAGVPGQGMLGDCFLLRLVQGDRASHILIDCGILLGSDKAEPRMQAIAAHIVETTRGVLDLLVVTHEHWDHISGFAQAANVFLATPDTTPGTESLQIANLWMGWTEKDGDPQVEQLRARFNKLGFALNALAEKIGAAGNAGAAPAVTLQGFRGPQDNGAKRLKGRDILKLLKRKSKAPPAFLEPGTVLPTPTALPGAPSLRAYVLGPPRNEKLLFKDSPTKSAPETYGADLRLSDDLLRYAESSDAAAAGVITPFAPHYCTLKAHALRQAIGDRDDEDEEGAAASAGDRAGQTPPTLDGDAAWVAEHYYGYTPPDPARTKTRRDRALEAVRKRRRIDDDWLGAAGPLALKLDSDTNNTSLALAFDLPDGSAMVFAADAQVGNWLSWHSHSYRDETGRVHSAEQILNRTRFYKVGHHGSHNATLNDLGLAMMKRDDLVAAIPTDEAFGKKQGRGGWQMPNPGVKAALMGSTRGRILRNDRRYDAAARAADPDLKHVEPGFFARIEDKDLYLEYRVL